MRRAVLKVSATDGKESKMEVLKSESIGITAVWFSDEGCLRLPDKPRVNESGKVLDIYP
jgi:hypothetical protein